jgi:hypothetical protein
MVNSDATENGMDDHGPYVVTFAVSFERMPLEVPFVHELEHFSAFRSHSIERGHAVFRHHVGYYETQQAARAALRVVRRHYTDAYVSTAPNRGLGSLDDTGITEFSMARPVGIGGALPDPGRPARRTAAALPMASAALCEAALQRYAIQLDALRRADASVSTPDLEVLGAHMLYRVHVLLDGQLHQALRLGFFPSMDAVLRVLERVRTRCPQANVVPVSGREYARVRDLLSGRGHDGPAAHTAVQTPSASLPTISDVVGEQIAARYDGQSGDDVSCEFGANELPTAGRVAPHHSHR